VRRAFERLAELQREVERHKLRIGQLQDERKGIFEDQKRIRDNLARGVPRDSSIAQRYVAKLNDQENALESIVEQLDQAERRRREASDALAVYIRDLKV
jgi:chromosome segregation ATPase